MLRVRFNPSYDPSDAFRMFRLKRLELGHAYLPNVLDIAH